MALRTLRQLLISRALDGNQRALKHGRSEHYINSPRYFYHRYNTLRIIFFVNPSTLNAERSRIAGDYIDNGLLSAAPRKSSSRVIINQFHWHPPSAAECDLVFNENTAKCTRL